MVEDSRSLRAAYLAELGIDLFQPRAPVPFGPGDSSLMNSQSDWDSLRNEIRACHRCDLSTTRTQVVIDSGNPAANWMFVGEAPGEQEDLQGEPFVGRAGQLLEEMIHALGLTRESVYIANILKCRPPRNRDPLPIEVELCESFLVRQVQMVKPAILIALGRIAAQNLLKTQTPIGKLRGQVHEFEGTPLIVTYHPAYLLRSQTEKRRAWQDLCLALSTIRAA